MMPRMANSQAPDKSRSATCGADTARIPRIFAVVAAFFLLASPAPVAGQSYNPQIRTTSQLNLKIDVIGVRAGRSALIGHGVLDASPAHPGSVRIPLGFALNDLERVTGIDVAVTLTPIPAGGDRAELVTELAIARGADALAPVRRVRTLGLGESSSILHVAFEDQVHGTAVTLMLSPELRAIPEVATTKSLGAPIAFHVTLTQLVDGLSVSVEEADLQTFENTPVTSALKRVADFPPTAEEASERAAQEKTSDQRKAKKKKKKDADAVTQPGATDGAPSAAGAAAGAAAGGTTEKARVGYDDLLLTLLPRLSSEGILTVEASLTGQLHGGPPNRGILAQRTQAVTRGGSFVLEVPPPAPDTYGYRFAIEARF